MTVMSQVPRYDLLDGLGRRRRLIRAGYKPNELVEKVRKGEEGSTICEHEQQSEYSVAAE